MALINKLSAIGNAIRSKTGKSAKLTLDEMPNEIASIKTKEDLDSEITSIETKITALHTIFDAWDEPGYTVTIEGGYGGEEYGSWLSYSTDSGATWEDITNYSTTLQNVSKIRFNWTPSWWAEARVYYGGEWDEELEYWIVAPTYIGRDKDITLTENTLFNTEWAP